ncbi:hypothetical protein C8Q72DRAFT_947850 [Fomitopsis betulina]|nr:hypothetical protein C8Q72DRAFT_947850 [Fomitopsis betulina]
MCDVAKCSPLLLLLWLSAIANTEEPGLTPARNADLSHSTCSTKVKYVPPWMPEAGFKRQPRMSKAPSGTWSTTVSDASGAVQPSVARSILEETMKDGKSSVGDEHEIASALGALYTATRCSVIAMVLYPKVQSKAPVELTELWAIRGISARTLWTQMRETHGSPCSASEDGDYPHPYRLCSTPNSGHDSMCPGRLLTDSSIFLAIVHLLFVFDILPPKGCDAQRLLHPTACRDCEMLSGMILHRLPKPFKCRVVPRSYSELENAEPISAALN